MKDDQLRSLWGQRIRVSGTFAGPGSIGLLFEDIADYETGNLLRNHCWIPKEEFKYRMRIGDRMSFDGRVSSYEAKWGEIRRLKFGLNGCNNFSRECCGIDVVSWKLNKKLKLAEKLA
jgi:hypothetical protein